MRAIVISILLCSAPALAGEEPAAPTRAAVLHVPPLEAEAEEPLELVAVIDGAWLEPELVARWRSRGGAAWHDALFERSSAGGWYATIPPDGVGRAGVEYFIVDHFASEDHPHVVPVVPSRIDQLAEQDLARAHRRTEEVGFDLSGHDFGNRYDSDDARHRDRFLRAEVRWTHRMFRKLYATTFGFGAIEGVTPASSAPDADEESTQARYGYGEVRVRAHPAVFLDARVSLGISHDGFAPGIGGAVTLGRPWGTSVSVGADTMLDMGPSGYVRLQWDTAPPLLMGASIVRTDLPGANLTNGVLVRYDVSYRVRDRVTTRASISYGARDGSAHFGGGLGAGYEF